jgi:hypothetical protein
LYFVQPSIWVLLDIRDRKLSVVFEIFVRRFTGGYSVKTVVQLKSEMERDSNFADLYIISVAL